MKNSTQNELLGGAGGAMAGGAGGMLGGYEKYGREASPAITHLKEGGIGRHLLMYLQKHPGLLKALKLGGAGALAGGAAGAGLAGLLSDDEE